MTHECLMCGAIVTEIGVLKAAGHGADDAKWRRLVPTTYLLKPCGHLVRSIPPCPTLRAFQLDWWVDAI